MRQRNGNRATAGMVYRSTGADQFIQRQSRQEAFDRQPAHWNHERRPDYPQLRFEPVGAAILFLARRNAVTPPARVSTRITPRNRGDVNLLSRRCFIETGALEPAEKRAAGAPGERLPTAGLNFSRRLTDEHDSRIHGAGDDRPDAGTQLAASAAGKGDAMRIKGAGSAGNVHVFVYTALRVPVAARRMGDAPHCF